MVGYRGGASSGMGRRGRCELWLLVAAVSSLNLEATVGVGYLYLKSDKYPCANCGRKQEGVKRHYFGPTQAAINLIYQF